MILLIELNCIFDNTGEIYVHHNAKFESSCVVARLSDSLARECTVITVLAATGIPGTGPATVVELPVQR